MSSKFELSIDVNYVKSWGIVEAVREFFQNSYDEEKQNPGNKSYFSYDKENKILTIGNKFSILKSETLLLGCTSKEYDDNTIGKFGEGYKIATVVALRTGHNVTIYNYGAKEVWTTKLVKSRKYNGRLVPTFYINKEFDWSSFFKTKDDERNLTIEISNITEKEYIDICKNNLNLLPIMHLNVDVVSPCRINTSFGSIITNEYFSGNVYVSGLFIYNNPQIKYGYDIKPDYVNLDRDRMTVNDFDLQWLTSKMWLESVTNNTNYIDDLVYMLDNNCNDVLYINSIIDLPSYTNSKNVDNVVSEVYSKFINKYGMVVPVTSDDMRRNLELSKNNSIVISKSYFGVLSRYEGFDSVVLKEESYYDRYKKLLDSLREFMTEEQINETDYLLENTEFILS